MADDTRTLILKIQADVEAAREDIKGLAGDLANSGGDIDKRLKDIEGSFSRSSGTISARAVGIAAAIGSGIGSFLGNAVGSITDFLQDAVKQTIEAASKIKDVSDSLGITTNALQDFRFAAQRAGVEVDDADRALEKFVGTTGDAANGNKTAVAAFNAVGVSVGDANGRLKPFDQLLRETIDGIAKLPDPARQAAAATDLFGSAGKDLLPVLRDGATGYNKIAEAADNLGIKLSDDTIRKMAELSEKADDVREIFTARLAVAIAENADSILGLATAAADAAGQLSKVLFFLNGLARVRRFEGFGTQFTRSIDTVAEIGAPGGAVKVYGREFNEASDRYNQAVEDSAGFRTFPGLRKLYLDFYRDRKEEARQAFLAASEEAARDRDRDSGPAAGAGGRVIPPAPARTRTPRRARAPFDLDGAVDGVLARDRAPLSIAGLSDDVRGSFDKITGDAQRAARTVQDALADAFSTESVDELVERLPDLAEGLDLARENARDFSLSFTGGFAAAIVRGEDLGDVVTNLGSRLAELSLNSIFDQLFGGLISSAFGGLFGGIFGGSGNIFGGAFADGGDPPIGKVSLVGERGPEWFVPKTAGTIVPIPKMGAAGVASGRTVNQYFNLSGTILTEQLYRDIEQRSQQSARDGAVGGRTMAAGDRKRDARRKLKG